MVSLLTFKFSLQMRGVSFVEPNGFSSTGRNLSSVANLHQKTKYHVTNHTVYRPLGNVDVANALAEARQREIQRHN